MKFAGTYHPIPFLIERLSSFVPGAKSGVGLWIGFDKLIYSSLSPSPISGNLNIKSQQLRQSKGFLEWTNHTDLFSESRNQSKGQLSFEDDTNLNVLKLFFPSPIDGLMDILLIPFPPNAFLKNLDLDFNGISAQEKQVLSNLLSSIFQAEYNRVFQERKFLLQLEKIALQKEEKIKQLSSDLETVKELYSSSIRNIIQHFVAQLEEEFQKEIRINDEVIYFLAKEQLKVEDVETVLKNAAYFAYNTQLSSSYIEIIIDYITIDQFKKNETPRMVGGNNNKVVYLLDNYEGAARRLLNSGKKVNGKNVASYLEPPITPPAITDAVKKNRNKISFLLKQFPDKWSTIRSSIRPIQNIDQENFGSSNKAI